MKKIEDIMLEMGFDKRAPDSTKKAFIKHLIQSAAELEGRKVEFNTKDESLNNEKLRSSTSRKVIKIPSAQLSFFDNDEFRISKPLKKVK